MDDTMKSSELISGGLEMGAAQAVMASIDGIYTVECFGEDGQLKWAETIENLWTTVGRNDALDKYLSGAAYTQTINMGLKGAGVAVIADTQASHASWLEVGLANAPTYTGGRKVPAFSAASAGSKATSAAVSFAITSTGTVAGCFLNNGGSTTIDNTTGILFSAGDFASSRAVISGDTLNITYTATLT